MDVVEVDDDGYVYAQDKEELYRLAALVKNCEFVRRPATNDYKFRFRALLPDVKRKPGEQIRLERYRWTDESC
jgi:hypothetical protein